jgi:hypothetical protein
MEVRKKDGAKIETKKGGENRSKTDKEKLQTGNTETQKLTIAARC